ncbi:NAD(P)/FAD-dependent oxidoreductase [Paenibacillus hodogayensis]|uniref:NAD(P)/FAD-dependent oxidoreductase n=1 Tax=Paenibacillus hodogayensis TaxID=279208 RepID=A0ABV5VR35_9BACL
MSTVYDCAIVGGGVAGLQAAIQMGRYGRSTLVVDKGDGRSTVCRLYRNILGWPDGISGQELRRLGREQAERTGVRFVQDGIAEAGSGEGLFWLKGQEDVYQAKTVLLATGIVDRYPPLPGLEPCLGKTVYVCPDCDGYEIQNRRTVIMGSGDSGAQMALILSERTDKLLYVNHEGKDVAGEVSQQLSVKGITVLIEPIERVVQEEDGSTFHGVVLANGRLVEAERGFIAFGGNEVRSALAGQLGAERHENGHIMTDSRSKMTSVPNVWAAGDIGVHAEQVTIAMGEGSQAAIWMHKALRQMDQSAYAP